MRRLLVALLFVGCAAPSTDPPALPEGLANAPSRWVLPKPVGDDAALWVLPAQVQADIASQGEVSTLVLGRVDKVHVRPGDAVAAGDAVAELFAPDAIRHAAAYRSAQAQLRLARSRVNALRRLRREGLAATGQTYDARRDLAELEAQAAAAKAHLRAAGIAPEAFAALAEGAPITLRSPSAGIVRSVSGRIGEVHGPADGPLVDVVGTGSARVQVRLNAALPGQSRVVFRGLSRPDIALQITPIGSVPHPDGMGQLTWFAPRDLTLKLPDGLRGTVRVSPIGDDLHAVPGAALLERDGQMQIAVRQGQTQRWQTVEVLRAGGTAAVIRAPLKPGEMVAADARLQRQAQLQAQQATAP